MKMKKAKIIFQPCGRRGKVPTGISIVEASRIVGADVEALCGEKKVCGKCKVHIEEGTFQKLGVTSSLRHVSPWQEEEEKFISPEERMQGYRLGCCAKIWGDLLVFVPEQSRVGKQVVSKAARDIPISHNPAIMSYYVQLCPPTIEDSTADFQRLYDALKKEFGLKDLRIDVQTLRGLSLVLRQGNWNVTVSVWMDREIVRVRPGKEERCYGLAVDIGTTTVVGHFCDLKTMKLLNTVSFMNPQCRYGEDVMSRITYHMTTEGGLARMSQALIDGLNHMVEEGLSGMRVDGDVSSEKGEECVPLSGGDIEDMTIVCNTVMHHILLKINPEYVGSSPFPPAVAQSLDVKAHDLGIHIHPSAYVHMLPIEAGFVGADNVGVLIEEEPYKSEEIQLIIDIGTNGELVIGNKDKLISSSCATGPALEGAQLKFGMRAAPGAIERIKIDFSTHDVDYKVIGRDAWRGYSQAEEIKAKGICGSGILDVFAELYRCGIIRKSGAFNREEKSNRFRKNAETMELEFVIAWAQETSIKKDIVITQNDIRQVQLAKGAVYCGCKLMMRHLGIDKVDRVKIAGAFGNHVDREKALIMGLFPDCEINRIVPIGNAAGDGARIALLNREKRKEADWVCRHVEYLELTLEKDFQDEFVKAMQIPHMVDAFPHLEGLVSEEILHQ